MLGFSNLATEGTRSLSPPHSRFNRNYLVAGGVVLFHVAALWALQSGLIRRAVEVVVPVLMVSELLRPEPEAAAPTPAPPVQKKQQPVAPRPRPVIAPTPTPAPEPVAVADPTPQPHAPTGVALPQPPAPPIAVPMTAAPAPALAPLPAPLPPRVVLPSTDADYLQNPKPAYPPLSKRLGEQGRVMVRALISAEGTVQSASVSQSSGYSRLDDSALAAVLKWRFVPGKRGGIPEAMWHQIPVNYVLE